MIELQLPQPSGQCHLIKPKIVKTIYLVRSFHSPSFKPGAMESKIFPSTASAVFLTK